MSIFFETISFIEVNKDAHMQRFVSGKAHILVATTVIEVGVNVTKPRLQKRTAQRRRCAERWWTRGGRYAER